MYAAIKSLHFLLGLTALASYWTAGLARKGSRLHRHAGRVFLLAMCGILASGSTFVVHRLSIGQPVMAGFLFYLLVITSTAMWTAWRAPRDKRDFAAYTGSVYRALAWGSIASAATSLALGTLAGALLLQIFSIVGFYVGWDMQRYARREPDDPRWWVLQHGEGMIGCGIATHVAFLAIGLPELLPALAQSNLMLVAWLGPVALALIARAWLRRKHGRRVAAARDAGQTSPSLAQPSPVPRAYTRSAASTSPAATAGSLATRA